MKLRRLFEIKLLFLTPRVQQIVKKKLHDSELAVSTLLSLDDIRLCCTVLLLIPVSWLLVAVTVMFLCPAYHQTAIIITSHIGFIFSLTLLYHQHDTRSHSFFFFTILFEYLSHYNFD